MEAAMEFPGEYRARQGEPTFIDTVGNLPSDGNREDAVLGSTAGFSRVLVVEDDPLLTALYTRLLQEKNMPVDQCADGGNALERLSTMDYDLVILDMNLPGMDGISLAEWIQRHRPATRTVVISGDANPDKIRAAMRAGSEDYLLKPFTIQQFWEMLERLTQPRCSSRPQP